MSGDFALLSLGPLVNALLCMPSLIVGAEPALVVDAGPQPALDAVGVVHHAGNLGPYWSSCEDLPWVMFGDGLGNDVTKSGTICEGSNLSWLSPPTTVLLALIPWTI